MAEKKKSRRGGARANSGGARPGAGRPSEYNVAQAERICKELREGKSLIKICEAKDMPHRETVVRWLQANAEFEANYARARVSQADMMDDKILDAADACTADDANAVRVKIMAYQWRASRLQPRKYGLKEFKEVTGDNGGPLRIDVSKLTDAELQTFIDLNERVAIGTNPVGETGTGKEKAEE